MSPQQPASANYQLPGKNSKKALIASIALAVLLVATAVFAYSSYANGQDYKNNTDKKIAAAVAAAEKAQAAKLQAQFDEQSKSPYKTFSGSATYGSLSFNYPKSWSAYVDESASGNQLVNAYFHPNQVPGTQSDTAFALRVELVSEQYSAVVDNFQSQISDGTLKAAAYLPPKMKGVTNVQPGLRFDGGILQDNKSQGSMVVIQVRDKTLKIYTETKNFQPDFDNIVLPSLSFAP